MLSKIMQPLQPACVVPRLKCEYNNRFNTADRTKEAQEKGQVIFSLKDRI